MSVRVQTYVWQLTLTPTQKLVAIALADHCHDDGSEARPSQALLCKKTGLSERTVRGTLGDLVGLGVLRIDRPAAQHRPNCYYFPIPDGFAQLRGAATAGLVPEGQMTHQRGNSRHSEGQEMPPNHKEPSVETTAINSSIQVRKAKAILRGIVDTEAVA
jgi:hypothetical protein